MYKTLIQAAILMIGCFSLDAFGYQSMAHSIDISIKSNGSGSLEFVSLLPRTIPGRGTMDCKAQFLPKFPTSWNVRASGKAQGSHCEMTTTMSFADLGILGEQLDATAKSKYLSLSNRSSVAQEGEDVLLRTTVISSGRGQLTEILTVSVSMPEIKSFTGEDFATYEESSNKVSWEFPPSTKGTYSHTVEVRGALSGTVQERASTVLLTSSSIGETRGSTTISINPDSGGTVKRVFQVPGSLMSRAACARDSFVDSSPKSWALKHSTRWVGTGCEMTFSISFQDLKMLARQLEVISPPTMRARVIQERDTVGIRVTAVSTGQTSRPTSHSMTVRLPSIESFTGKEIAEADMQRNQITWSFPSDRQRFNYDVEVRGSLTQPDALRGTGRVRQRIGLEGKYRNTFCDKMRPRS